MSHSDPLNRFSRIVVGQIRSRFGDFDDAQEPISDWLARFQPADEYTAEVLKTLKMQLSVGLLCSKVYASIPPTLSHFLHEYRFTIYPAYRKKYRGLDPRLTEVFCFHHGLKRLDPAVTAGLKEKDFLDIGAFNGDSALVLSPYAGRVHSIEISSTNFPRLLNTLAENPEITANVRPYFMGIGETSGFQNASGSVSEFRQGDDVEIMSVDEFVVKNNLTIGFMKADVTGLAFAMVKGARQTMVRDRPIFSFSAYHAFHEMYDMSLFLMELLGNYHFEWHMENSIDWAFFELSLFGCPNELLALSQTPTRFTFDTIPG